MPGNVQDPSTHSGSAAAKAVLNIVANNVMTMRRFIDAPCGAISFVVVVLSSNRFRLCAFDVCQSRNAQMKELLYWQESPLDETG